MLGFPISLPFKKDDAIPINPRPFGGGRSQVYDEIDPSYEDFTLSKQTKGIFGSVSSFNANPSEAYLEQMRKKDQEMAERIPRIREATQLQLSIADKANQILGIESDFKTELMQRKEQALDTDMQFGQTVRGYIGKKQNYSNQMQETLRLLKGA